MKQLDFTKIYSFSIFVARVWKIFLFSEDDSIGAELTKEELTLLTTILLNFQRFLGDETPPASLTVRS